VTISDSQAEAEGFADAADVVSVFDGVFGTAPYAGEGVGGVKTAERIAFDARFAASEIVKNYTKFIPGMETVPRVTSFYTVLIYEAAWTVALALRESLYGSDPVCPYDRESGSKQVEYILPLANGDKLLTLSALSALSRPPQPRPLLRQDACSRYPVARG